MKFFQVSIAGRLILGKKEKYWRGGGGISISDEVFSLHKTKHDKYFANIDLFIFSSLKCCNFTLTPMPNFVDNGYGFTEGRDFRELAFSNYLLQGASSIKLFKFLLEFSNKNYLPTLKVNLEPSFHFPILFELNQTSFLQPCFLLLCS